MGRQPSQDPLMACGLAHAYLKQKAGDLPCQITISVTHRDVAITTKDKCVTCFECPFPDCLVQVVNSADTERFYYSDVIKYIEVPRATNTR